MKDRLKRLPNSYLTRFTVSKGDANGLVWVYERGSSEIRLSSLDTLPALDFDTDTQSMAIEDGLQKLIATKQLADLERTCLARFISMQWMRISLSRQEHDVRNLSVLEGASLTRERHLEIFAEMLNSMNWTVRTTDESEPLVTSDCPVILNNSTTISSLGPPTPLAYELIFPLSRTALMITSWDGHQGTGPLSPRVVHQINRLVARTADRFVYSSTRITAIARYLVEPRQTLIHPRFPDVS